MTHRNNINRRIFALLWGKTLLLIYLIMYNIGVEGNNGKSEKKSRLSGMSRGGYQEVETSEFDDGTPPVSYGSYSPFSNTSFGCLFLQVRVKCLV